MVSCTVIYMMGNFIPWINSWVINIVCLQWGAVADSRSLSSFVLLRAVHTKWPLTAPNYWWEINCNIGICRPLDSAHIYPTDNNGSPCHSAYEQNKICTLTLHKASVTLAPFFLKLFYNFLFYFISLNGTTSNYIKS